MVKLSIIGLYFLNFCNKVHTISKKEVKEKYDYGRKILFRVFHFLMGAFDFTFYIFGQKSAHGILKRIAMAIHSQCNVEIQNIANRL